MNYWKETVTEKGWCQGLPCLTLTDNSDWDEARQEARTFLLHRAVAEGKEEGISHELDMSFRDLERLLALPNPGTPPRADIPWPTEPRLCFMVVDRGGEAWHVVMLPADLMPLPEWSETRRRAAIEEFEAMQGPAA